MQLFDANGNLIAETTTDVNGYYIFDDLDPVSIRFTKFNRLIISTVDARSDQLAPLFFFCGVKSTTDIALEIVVGSGQDGVNYDFCEFYPSSIAGNVWADPEGNGVYGSNDILANDVTLELARCKRKRNRHAKNS